MMISLEEANKRIDKIMSGMAKVEDLPARVSAQEQSDRLRQEAYDLINLAFQVGTQPNLELNRLVDCIIGAAVLQVAALQEKAIREGEFDRLTEIKAKVYGLTKHLD